MVIPAVHHSRAEAAAIGLDRHSLDQLYSRPINFSSERSLCRNLARSGAHGHSGSCGRLAPIFPDYGAEYTDYSEHELLISALLPVARPPYFSEWTHDVCDELCDITDYS